MSKKEEVVYTHLEGEKLPNFKSLSGIEYKEYYDKPDWNGELSPPGEYPFVRGIHRDMYRGRLWTRRQQAGFGLPEDGNKRIKYLLAVGQTGINMDADVPTQTGLDPDYSMAQAGVGLEGTSLSTYEDLKTLFEGIPLDRVSSTLIIQPPHSAVIMAQYLLMAQERGVPWDKLIGTIMNCSITQYVGGTLQSNMAWFPFDLSVKIGYDLIEYITPRIPRWNIININAYNMRGTGIDAIQEAAFSMALAADYIKGLLRRGLDIDSFAHRMAFFTAADIDLFEEVAKLRAMRRIWARMLRDKFKAKNKRSMQWRTAIQTSALPLTAQQPLNNIVRATIQTLAAVLAGTQSIHTTGYDEAYALPTEESHKLSVRTQQIIAYETKAGNSADPLGGSYLVEHMTDEIEERAWALMKLIEDKGGFIQCYKDGWVEDQINEARYKHAEAIEENEKTVIGVNKFQDEDEEIKINIFRHAGDMQEKRIRYILDYKKNRNQDAVKRALQTIYDLTKNKPDVNIVESIVEAVKAKATLQEIDDAMRQASNFEMPR